MRARIHRGATEVGGNCVEIEAQGSRLVLDLGRPLWADRDEEIPLPAVPGLGGGDPSLLGVVITHAHADHYGLVQAVPEEVPLIMGDATARILREAAFFTPIGLDRESTVPLRDRIPIERGPFRLTPYLVDHSAFDAYALLVEADGSRLLYSGDLRAHGRKAQAFERLLQDVPFELDVLLLEGTRLGRDERPNAEPSSEADVEDSGVDLMRATSGLVLAAFSMQNIDRLVSFYRAAVRSDRELVVDLYGAAVAAATGNPRVPQPGFDRLRVYVPASQRKNVIRSREFERIDAVRAARIYSEELSARSGSLVIGFRPTMLAELDRAGCLGGSRLIWSMWPGYLDEPWARVFLDSLAHRDIPMSIVHASGHASVADLARMATTLAPRRIVPIHTASPERFAEAFGHAELRGDGEWWEV
jgi:ribonuclease J